MIISDKDILSSLLSKSFGLVLQLLLILYVAKELTIVESNVYFTVGVLSQLTMALIYGFNSTLLRLVNYSFTGIPIKEFVNIKHKTHLIKSPKSTEKELFFIRKTIVRALTKASIIYFLVFLIFGLFFLENTVIKSQLSFFWIYFFFYLILNSLGIALSSEQIYLRGLGLVPKVEKNYLTSNLILILTTILVVVFLGDKINVGHLLCLNGTSLFLPNLLIFKSSSYNKLLDYETNSEIVNVLNKEIFDSTIKSGFSSFIGSLSKNISSLFVVSFFPVADSSSFLFTKKLIDIVENIMMTIYNSKIPSLNRFRVTDIKNFKRLLSKVFRFTQNIFILFSLVIIFLGDYLIALFNFNSVIVAKTVLILMLISSLSQRWAGIILASFNQSNKIIEHIYSIITIFVMSILLVTFYLFDFISFESMIFSELFTLTLCSFIFFKEHYSLLNTTFLKFEKNLILIRILFLFILFLIFYI